MTMDQVDLQVPARVTGFRGLAEAEILRLSSHGLRVGSVLIKLLATPLKDPVECLVGTQLIALEAALLGKILVEL